MSAPQTTAFHTELLSRDDGPADDLLSYRTFAAKLEKERDTARSLLQQMLDVAENCDETGYAEGVGFVDLNKLHAEVRAALLVVPPPPFDPAEVMEAQKHAHEKPLQLD